MITIPEDEFKNQQVKSVAFNKIDQMWSKLDCMLRNKQDYSIYNLKKEMAAISLASEELKQFLEQNQ